MTHAHRAIAISIGGGIVLMLGVIIGLGTDMASHVAALCIISGGLGIGFFWVFKYVQRDQRYSVNWPSNQRSRQKRVTTPDLHAPDNR